MFGSFKLFMLMQDIKKPRVYLVTSYGADPTGNSDSTEALLAAIEDAVKGPSQRFLMKGISDLGGAQINLQGGNYLISKPLQFPVAGVGNLMVCLQIPFCLLHSSSNFIFLK